MNHQPLAGLCLCLGFLTGCEQPVEGLNLVGYVDTGPLGHNALLAEVCLDDVPYYLLLSTVRTGAPGTRGALAPRYRPDGSIPACRAGQTPVDQPFMVKLGGTLAPNLEHGRVCLFGVRYQYVTSNHVSGLAPALTGAGAVQPCG